MILKSSYSKICNCTFSLQNVVKLEFLTARMYCGSGLKKDLIVVVIVVVLVISLLSNLSIFDSFLYIFVKWKNIFPGQTPILSLCTDTLPGILDM